MVILIPAEQLRSSIFLHDYLGTHAFRDFENCHWQDTRSPRSKQSEVSIDCGFGSGSAVLLVVEFREYGGGAPLQVRLRTFFRKIHLRQKKRKIVRRATRFERKGPLMRCAHSWEDAIGTVLIQVQRCHRERLKQQTTRSWDRKGVRRRYIASTTLQLSEYRRLRPVSPIFLMAGRRNGYE